MTSEAKGMGKGLLIGVFAGAAVGSVVALLYAPKSGKRLREDIRNKSQDFIDDSEKYYLDAKRKVSRFIAGVKKKSESLISDVEEEVDTLVNDAEKIICDTKEKIAHNVEADKIKIENEKEHLKSALKTDKHGHS